MRSAEIKFMLRRRPYYFMLPLINEELIWLLALKPICGS
jgi:hypothetical protein